MAADLDSSLLQAIDDAGSIQDTADFAEARGVNHLALVGIMKSLIAAEMITAEVSVGIAQGGGVAQ